MHIHILQHVSFEGPGFVATWANTYAHKLTTTRLYAGEVLPEHNQYDRLIVMGGPMNIYEYAEYPWLKSEKRFIREAIDQGKTIVGICLGAQLLADVLGAKVYAGPKKEIGWFPITLTSKGRASRFFAGTPDHFSVLHWHGDTFDLPDDCVHLASSAVCTNQAFIFDNRVLGLQFHCEATSSSLAALLDHCEHELEPADYVQTRYAIEQGGSANIPFLHGVMKTFLEQLP